jgi:pyrroline-5-carboxylate reductase
MGSALLRGWQAAGLGGQWRVIDPALVAPPAGTEAGPGSDPPLLVVLAVKPQIWRAAIAGLEEKLAGSVLVSVMAGVPIAALEAAIPGAIIVRAMPNTPAAIGRGVTGLFSAHAASRPLVTPLFEASGDAHWLDREADFDALTGVSGSGPAYVFAFIEALAAAGEAQGLSPGLAMALARGTVTGAAALAASDPAEASELRRRVTSPGGTTAAGLAALTPGLSALLESTVRAAANRSRELAGEGS